jgi:hypothetical protein
VTWQFQLVSGSPGTTLPGAPPTQQQVSDYMTSLPDTDPLSVPNHTKGVGAGAGPTPADQTSSKPASTADIPSQIKPKAAILPTDTVIVDSVPTPEGTTVDNNLTQSVTTTTTTTTNPDGSVTEQTQETVNPSCTAQQKEPRTFASVLSVHQLRWQATGLIGAVNLLKNLTWPTALPTTTLPSALFGTVTVNWNDWATQFTAIRTILIAVASLAAYRIIFVGGR